MTKRLGARAGRDTGSTTGVATAVLALLSAGTLATLGVVTAGELRGVGPGRPDSSPGALGPPAAVVITPAPTTGPSTGTGGRGGGRRTAQPVPLPLGPTLAIPSLATASPGTGAGGPDAGAAATPTPVPGAGPVLTSVLPEPVPAPQPSVLAAKHGKALGHATAHGRNPRKDHVPPAAAGPTSVTFLGNTPRGPVQAVTPAGAQAAEARKHTAAYETPARREHTGKGHVSPPAASPASAPMPSAAPLVEPAPPAESAPAVVAGPGNGQGHAYGRGEH